MTATGPGPAAQRSGRRKPPEAFVTETRPDTEGGELSRSIGLFQLTMFGVGATIGTGIFIVLTEAVPEAGPAVVSLHSRGSRPRSRRVLRGARIDHPCLRLVLFLHLRHDGEIVAFGVAACLLLEYGVSSAAVSVGWSHLNSLFSDVFGFRMPDAILAAPGEGGVLNLPAIVLVTLCCLLLAWGAGIRAGEHDHGPHQARGPRPVHRYRVHGLFGRQLPTVRPFGIAGIGAAASSIFFIGLDAVSTAGEEVHNPRRNLPLAILFATVIVTTFTYSCRSPRSVRSRIRTSRARRRVSRRSCATSPARTCGPRSWPRARSSRSSASRWSRSTGRRASCSPWARRDAPEVFHRVDPRTLAPVRNTIIVGLFVGASAGFVPLGVLIDLTSMGTLVAFTVVSIGVIILRRTQPDLPRGFRGPRLSGNARAQRGVRHLHNVRVAANHVWAVRGSGSRRSSTSRTA